MIILISKKAPKHIKGYITLMSVAGKVIKKMLLNRIYEPIDNIQLRPFQKGFRKRVETAWSKFIY